MRVNPFVLAAVLVAMAACSRQTNPAEKSKSGAAPAATPPGAPPAEQGPAKAVPGEALAQLALDQMSGLQSRVALGEWRPSHAIDLITTTHAQPLDSPGDPSCAHALDPVVIDGDKTMRRTAYFYVPAAPDVATVPAESPEDLRDQCRLGLVWIETADDDAKRAAAVATAATQTLTAGLGSADASVKLNFGGDRATRWQMSDVFVALGISKPGASAGATRVLVGAAGPASGMTFVGLFRDPSVVATQAAERAVSAARLEDSLSLAGGDDGLEKQMRAFHERFQRPQNERTLPASERTSFISVLAEWVKRSADLPAMRRASALVAADLLLAESSQLAGWHEPKQSALRKPLQAQGATFNAMQLAPMYAYSHSWLKQAERMNAGGRSAELAFLSLASLGFETSGMCSDQGTDGFDAVIRRSEEFLRTHPETSIATDLHFLMAQAYADIVSLGDGAGGERADADDYRAKADRARTRALEEFRLGFAAEPGSPRAQALWSTAWRLAAGLSPTRTFFFCVYD